MKSQRTLSVAVLSLLAASAVAFSVVQPSGLTSQRSTCRSEFASTWLRAEDEKEAEAPPAADQAVGETDDILNSPAFLQRKLEVLKSDFEKLEAGVIEAKQQLEANKAEWGSQIEDLSVEYKNIQARMANQNKQGDTMATTLVCRELLSVLDNFDRAFGAIPAETDEQKAIEAEYKKAYQTILDTFDKLGVKEVKTVGVEFDYEVHQAVMQMPNDDYEEGIVCEEFQKGFVLGKSLIRAAMVGVAA